MDDRLKKWIRWLEIIYYDITQLLVKQNIFWELQDIIKANSKLQKPSSFYKYLGDTYIAYITIGIRRQIKNDKYSISFARLLTELSQTPSVLSRKYFIGLYSGFAVEHLANRDFDKFCGINKDYISPDIVNADLNELNWVASVIEDFTDKRIAHHDKREPKILPKFEEVDSCLGVLDKLYCKYHLAFHASFMNSLMPTYQYDWKQIFTIPWIK